MKISTKGRYALRLMLDLALHEQSGYVPIKVIAERQDISDKYLEQIISILARAGFVKSVRGAGGGYKLAKTPAEYTVGMILRLTEGSLACGLSGGGRKYLSTSGLLCNADGMEKALRCYKWCC